MVEIHKYVGRIVDIIYKDKQERITKRRIQIHSVRGEDVQAFCMTTGAPRKFSASNILAVQPVIRRAG